MFFIDTHCHISDPAFSSEEEAYIGRALEAGVGLMLQPDVDSSERQATFDLVDRHPDVLRPMLGLYPGSVGRDWESELEKMVGFHEDWMASGSAGAGGHGRRKVVAIGEVGLDYHEGKDWAKEQKEAFAAQLEYAASLGLPVNIHLRDAFEDLISVLKAHKHLGLRGNLHAYSGSYESFLEISKLGDWHIGVGGVVTFKNAGLAEVVRKAPLERIVLETDAPYLTPVPLRGKRNESSYIPLIAAKVAQIKGVSVEEVAETTTANATRLFSLETQGR